MTEETEVIQEKNTGARKGWFYDKEKGGYVPAKPKSLTGTEITERRNTAIILFLIGLVGILVYIFQDRLKSLWLQKTKQVLTSGV